MNLVYGSSILLDHPLGKHMRYFLISLEVDAGTSVNSDGDDIYHYQSVRSVLTCQSLAEAQDICSEINAQIVREIQR